MTVFVARRDSACFEPPVNKTSSEAFGIHHLDRCLCLIRDVVLKLAHADFRRHFLAATRASKSKGKYRTTTKRCILLMKFLTVPDTNNLIVNIKLTEIKVTVVIKLKWPNLDYPFFYLVARPALNVSCDHQT
jgi:hypothetical protein